jgi:hypothetical protein
MDIVLVVQSEVGEIPGRLFVCVSAYLNQQNLYYCNGQEGLQMYLCFPQIKQNY